MVIRVTVLDMPMGVLPQRLPEELKIAISQITQSPCSSAVVARDADYGIDISNVVK